MSVAIATEDAVRAAVLRILQDPQLKLTNDAVIELLGGGSKATIAPLVRKFREEFGGRNHLQDAIPVQLAAEAELLVKRLYSAAKEEARREYEADSLRLSRILSGMQYDLDVAIAEAETASAEALKLQADLGSAQHAISKLETEWLSVQETSSSLESDLHEARRDLDRANETIETLRARANEGLRLEERLSRIEAALPTSSDTDD